MVAPGQPEHDAFMQAGQASDGGVEGISHTDHGLMHWVWLAA
jgi:hypothetical protein